MGQGLPAFIIPASLVFLGLLAILIRPLIFRLSGWASTSGTVETADLAWLGGGYELRVTYFYDVAGQRYAGDFSRRWSASLEAREETADSLRHFAPGALVRVLYRASRPYQSRLAR